MNIITTVVRALRALAARIDRFTLQEGNAPLTHHMLAGDR